MLMPRSNRKATKVLYDIIGRPAPLVKRPERKGEKKVDDVVKGEYRNRIK